jgi:hypothetical protein
MKRVVSVSIGARARDHEAEIVLAGQTVVLTRRGTDGDLAEAERIIRDLDGTVDAIGLGGIDLYLVVEDRRFIIADAARLKAAASATPVVDGLGIKRVWEPAVVRELADCGVIRRGQRALMVSAMDRYFMARALADAGLDMVYGDLIFASRIDYPITTLQELRELAAKLLPALTRLPFQHLYPTGRDQEAEPDPRFRHYFDEADVIAGDFHFIRRYLPPTLAGKVLITNTTTGEDLDRLKARGASVVVTTTPRLGGRSFGANVLEAAIVAVSGVEADDPAWDRWVLEAGLEPDIQVFDAARGGYGRR